MEFSIEKCALLIMRNRKNVNNGKNRTVKLRKNPNTGRK